MEVIRSSETSVQILTTRRYIPQDGDIHNHRCEESCKMPAHLRPNIPGALCLAPITIPKTARRAGAERVPYFPLQVPRNLRRFGKYLASYLPDTCRHTCTTSMFTCEEVSSLSLSELRIVTTRKTTLFIATAVITRNQKHFFKLSLPVRQQNNKVRKKREGIKEMR
jgi:hypothetical protein